MSSSMQRHSDEYTDVLVIDDIRFRLKENRVALLTLFQNGRTVQPTDNVIRFVAPLVLQHPIDSRDIALLADILDPNNTKFVVLKRIHDLVGKMEETVFAAAGQNSNSLVLVHSGQQELLTLAPPKRAPPSAVEQIIAKQRNQDPDKVAIMMALTWSGKHLSGSATKRFEPPVEVPPLSRFIRPIDVDQLAYKFQDQDLSQLHTCLARQIHDSRERGKVCIALCASYILAEVALRINMLGKGENAKLVQAIVPENILHSFVSTHRMHRLRVLEEKSHEIFLRLSPVRLPLVLTTLRVEMESAARHMAAYVLSYNHSGRHVLPCWLALTEKQRAAFATSMWELQVWDEEMWHLLCSDDDGNSEAMLEVLLLPRQQQQQLLQNGQADVGQMYGAWEGKTELEVWLESLQQQIKQVEDEVALVKQWPVAREYEEEEEAGNWNEASDLDAEIHALRTRVDVICGEIWL